MDGIFSNQLTALPVKRGRLHVNPAQNPAEASRLHRVPSQTQTQVQTPRDHHHHSSRAAVGRASRATSLFAGPLARLGLGWVGFSLAILASSWRGGLGRGRRPWCGRGGERREGGRDTRTWSSGSWGGAGFFVIARVWGGGRSELFTRLGVCSTFSVFVQGGFGGTKDSGACACTVGIAYSGHSWCWVRRGAGLVLYLYSAVSSPRQGNNPCCLTHKEAVNQGVVCFPRLVLRASSCSFLFGGPLGPPGDHL